jgi:hypothetical protein
VRKLRVGKWRILDGKGESGLMSDLELLSGSPCMCRLRTVLVRPCEISIDYVLMHTGFMGPRKLNNFGSHRVGQSLTSPTVMYIRIVYVPPTDSPACAIAWKMYTRKRWDLTRLFDRCCELWPLMVPSRLMCVVLSSCYLTRCILIQIFMTALDMGDGLIPVSKRSN